MGSDEPALQRLWREKRGEAEPQDHSGNLLVQIGLATEHLNLQWYERTTGQIVKDWRCLSYFSRKALIGSACA